VLTEAQVLKLASFNLVLGAVKQALIAAADGSGSVNSVVFGSFCGGEACGRSRNMSLLNRKFRYLK
jgi:hypothetical protein